MSQDLINSQWLVVFVTNFTVLENKMKSQIKHEETRIL